MKSITIQAVDIQDAWFQCISSIIDNGFKYKIQHGSYVGQTRLEFDHITIVIKKAYQEPYDLMLPQIPAHLNIPNPVENGYVEQYLPYLMTGEKKPGEDYTYGERIAPQIPYWIKVFKETPNTNQAVLQVAQPSDHLLKDPPCLRHIDMRVKEVFDTYTNNDVLCRCNERKELIFYPYFRSWDLWGGLPANLAGIAVLQKYMADEIGVEVGPICASSKGLHIYGYVEELAKLRVNK